MKRIEFEVSILLLCICLISQPAACASDETPTTQSPSKRGLPRPYIIALGAAGLIVLLVAIAVVCFIIVYKKCCSKASLKYSPLPSVELEEKLAEKYVERKSEEEIERDNARLAVEYVLSITGLYKMKKQLPDMGSRMQKYWFHVTPLDDKGQSADTKNIKLLTIDPISQHCPLLSDGKIKEKHMKALRELMEAVKVHPFLQPVEFIYYYPDRKQVIIVQPFWEQGSLKDVVHKKKPAMDWADKYPDSKRGLFRSKAGLQPDKVARYGRQILEAIIFLRDKFAMKGLPQKFILGHVQSGNIFVDQDDVCRLGGYENTLLGYRSRFYRMCRDHLKHMDVIMFGHLVFEMSCGYELTTLKPTEKDYKTVKDERVKDVLQFIFIADEFPSIEDIEKHQFFESADIDRVNPKQYKLTSDMKTEILKKVLEYQDELIKAQRGERSSVAARYVERRTSYQLADSSLPDMGTHVSTSWFEVTATDTPPRHMLLCVTTIPVYCQIKVSDKKAQGRMTIEDKTLKTINEVLHQLQQHPCLHPILEVCCEGEHLMILKPFEPMGSLKDTIYGTSRKLKKKTCSEKYTRGKGLPSEKIALYGRQILEAMMFLYEKGFPVLGHVQSGNIFVGQDDVCRLGGYENTLLGYRSRFYRMCKDHLEHMDVIMFGHLVFEMSCGYELTTLAPTEKDHKPIKNENVKEILQFIFSYHLSNSIEDISNHKFFQAVEFHQLDDFDQNEVKITNEMKTLLKP